MVPFPTSPLSRGALRSAGVLTIAASIFPALQRAWLTRGWARSCLRHLGRHPARREGTPRVRRGLGSVGVWRFAIPLQKLLGVPTGWRCPSLGRSLPGGPPLGALRRRLRCAFLALRCRLPTAPWGIYEGGKQMRPAASPAGADEQARPRGQDARRPSDVVNPSAPAEGRLALTGTR